MSWDQLWTLPPRDLDRATVDAAVTKALEEFAGAGLMPPDPETAELAEDVSTDEDELGQFEFSVLVPRHWLEVAGDEPDEEAAEDDGRYVGMFTVSRINEEEPQWQICVHSNDAQNRAANLAVSTIAARLSVLLGGPEEPEPL